MTARTLTILNRFPLHVAATDPGKRLGEAVNALAENLDVLTRQAGDVRSGHRLGEAPAEADLLALAALHGISPGAFEPLRLRLAELPVRHRPALDLRRAVLTGVIAAHVIGNATPAALLTAAASYLGLAVESITHTEDRWWHFAACRDRVTPQADVLSMEENPFHPADIAPVPRANGHRFRVLRGGLDDVDVTVRVRGVGTRTVRPMVVHLNSGRGLVFEGNVPDGGELLFTANGQVTLAGTDVTGSAWAFSGAVYASASDAPPDYDFTFADANTPASERTARFVITTPLADAPLPTAPFPHGGPRVGPLRLPIGQSAWACFVRVAHFGGADAVVPRTSAGRFDAAVLETDAAPSLAVGFAWEEREPFMVRLLLPRRFSPLGDALRESVRLLLDRHKAAGVDVRVEFADPRWQLGDGVLRTTTDNPLGTVIAATELWPDGTPQP